MRVQLRPYQVKGIQLLNASIKRGNRSVCWVFPTGAGKSTITAQYVEYCLKADKRVLFMVHKKELVEQFADRLWNQFGISSGIIMSGIKRKPNEPVQVASVQTLVRRKFQKPDILFIDEAHHIKAKTYLKIIERCGNPVIVGLTATPFRTDGKPLGDVFDDLVHPVRIRKLIDIGHLVPTKVYVPEESVDMKGVHVRRGDYVTSEMYDKFNKNSLYAGAVKNYLKLAKGKKALVFNVNVEHSMNMTEQFKQHGIPAAHVDGTTPKHEREEINRKFAAGEIMVLNNYGIFTEGYDVPDCEVCILNRSTKSLSLFVQMVGRALRPAEGKTHAIVIDHGNNHMEHGFVEDYDAIPFDLHKDQKKKSKFAAKKAKRCGSCGQVNRPNATHCVGCGNNISKSKKKAEVHFAESGGVKLLSAPEGTWDKIKKLPHKKARELPVSWLRIVQMVKGYKKGWVMHVMCDRGLIEAERGSGQSYAQASYKCQMEERIDGTHGLYLEVKSLTNPVNAVA